MRGLLPNRGVTDAAGAARLVDEVIDRYVDWREECETVRSGYEAWWSGAEEERTIRFAVYNMALDREEWAAGLYSKSTQRLRRFLWPDLEPKSQPMRPPPDANA
jgi:hypothetical protein